MLPRMSARRRIGFAASFVVTVSASACSKKPPKPENRRESRTTPASVFASDGRCGYEPSVTCTPGATCNPPATIPLECAADGGVWIEKGKVKTTARIYAEIGACSYYPETYCEAPPSQRSCTPESPTKIDCRQIDYNKTERGNLKESPSPPAGKEHFVWVKSFKAKRADGKCIEYEEGWVDPSTQAPPQPHECKD
jgi:hypothetical protein